VIGRRERGRMLGELQFEHVDRVPEKHQVAADHPRVPWVAGTGGEALDARDQGLQVVGRRKL